MKRFFGIKKICDTFFFVLFVSLCYIFCSSCKKLVEVRPPVNYINSENVFSDNRTAIAAVTGIYVNTVTRFTGGGAISIYSGLSADELTLYNSSSNLVANAFFTNTLISDISASYGGSIWSNCYYCIFRANAAIAGLLGSESLTPSIKMQLLGEAKFMRAFFYFYLTSLYGDVPLVLGTDPVVNGSLKRASKLDVYKLIIEDLKEAQGLLSPQYLNAQLQPYSSANIERVRPTSWAATALLSRVYLYDRDYVNAEMESSKVIAQTSLYDTLPLNQVFKKNSKEAIWQLPPINSGRNVEDAFILILTSVGPGGDGVGARPYALSDDLMASFETGDKRGVPGYWVNSVKVGNSTYYYPYKYKLTTGVVDEYAVVFRLAEQYLIRAEARANIDKVTGENSAIADLNIVRIRAGLKPLAGLSKEAMISAVVKERRSEFFTEWGHRWLDLKRLGLVDAVMATAAVTKGSKWNSYQQLYPLPFSDLQASPALVQNEGYR